MMCHGSFNSTFAKVLINFGNAMGLMTNFDKSSLSPIQCVEIDIDNFFQDLPGITLSFLVKYLGLPLAVKRLKKSHFQYLEDKEAKKLAPWMEALEHRV
jgi:hypothetical protein